VTFEAHLRWVLVAHACNPRYSLQIRLQRSAHLAFPSCFCCPSWCFITHLWLSQCLPVGRLVSSFLLFPFFFFSVLGFEPEYCFKP
jgi:hypothetical protein